MADFDQAILFVLGHEDPGLTGKVTVDSGGVTRFGISSRSYPSLDVRNLTIDDAKAIYRRDYWDPLQLDGVPCQDEANRILDLAVNCGRNEAVDLLQAALKDCGYAVALDGRLGPATADAVRTCPDDRLLLCLRVRAAARYGAIALHNPALAKYLDGWLRRLES